MTLRERIKWAIEVRVERLLGFDKSARWYLYWLNRRLRCGHSHTWTITPSETWESYGTERGHHNHLLLRGCYLCGHVWTCDTGGPCGPYEPPSHRRTNG